ncbi:MAG: hypothetical protein M3R37_07950 [Actinomycetota bacterium]|nr:hypothetical protein [Actinomycetota bacterium]
MTHTFENAALTNREPKPRDGRRCASSQFRHGFAQIGAGAARSLPKSDSVGGPRFPGSGGLAREMNLEVREQLVHRGTFLAMPAPGACTTDDPCVFAPRVWAPSARLRPYAVDSVAKPAERGYALNEAA